MSFQTFAVSGERQSTNQAAEGRGLGTKHLPGKVGSGKLERLLSKEEKAETSKEDREIQWGSIFQRMSHLVWVLTPTGIVIEANAAALNLVNEELARLRGCLFWETGWCSPTTAVEVIKAIATGAIGNSWRGQLLVPSADGTEIILDFHLQPILNDRGAVVQLLAEGYELERRRPGARQRTKNQSKTATKDALPAGIVPVTRKIVLPQSAARVDASATLSGECLAISPREQISPPDQDKLADQTPKAELEESLSLVRATLEAQPYGILVFTLEGIVTAVNHCLGRIWQLDEAALEIRDLNQWLPLLANQCPDEAASRQHLEKLMGQTPSEATREIITLQDGRILEHHCHPLKVNERLVGQVWTFKDITECSRHEAARRQAEISAQEALTKERELSQWRSHFLSMLSHEFRKPLNTISLAVSALQNYGSRWGEEKKSQYMQRLHTAVYQVDRLLNDVLIIGRADALMLQCSPQPLNLAGFCRDSIAAIELETGKRNPIVFTGNTAQAYPPEIFNLDENFLKSILTNLLDNACKYSPSGSPVTLEVNVQGEEVIFRVQDLGIGIPKAAQKNLCQPFHRAQNVGDISGFGVGLAVVQKFVTIHGGQITWTSQEGQGTTFVVKLPINYQPHQSLANQTPEPLGKCPKFGAART
ncbi:MAG TPA: hypothetical protein IGS52_01815 [Oscillatoriaceae cyanobacterium M33_DOE_052]|uniref:histidine kinase n=1 Tax=Planktothricoides sp. SpSt-374 TaxID=2282167 RepID=A0A7C3VLR8_9CYAN|nr:hypothetical protein [Oscillatoriaceae cyanobacterium M33_DOE_052]